jgi:hypothetical protein
MRALGKFVVKVLLAICVFTCSRAVLAVARALGWFPEQQLANLILAAPTALQTEVVMWSMVALAVVGSWLLVDYFVHRRNYREAWHKIIDNAISIGFDRERIAGLLAASGVGRPRSFADVPPERYRSASTARP